MGDFCDLFSFLVKVKKILVQVLSLDIDDFPGGAFDLCLGIGVPLGVLNPDPV